MAPIQTAATCVALPAVRLTAWSLRVSRLQQSFRRQHLDLYADQAHFTHAFRHATAYTPGRYRKAFGVRFLQDRDSGDE
jgi:hypothetical protein